MCGIAGYFCTGGIQAGLLRAMSERLSHRGPDDEGFLLISETGQASAYRGPDTSLQVTPLPSIFEAHSLSYTLGIMHRRLSIIDLSPAAHQPMHDGSGNWLIINGEIYNYLELRTELQSAGHNFQSNSDSEVVLMAYRQWGLNCFKRFRGMWALAIYNSETRQLILSRDRFAIKPLYLYHDKDIFAFSSEIKAFFAIPEIRPELNPEHLYQYLAFPGLSDPNATLFKGIRELPPASCMVFDLHEGNTQTSYYYHLEEAILSTRIPDSLSEQREAFRCRFTDSVRIHLRADVAVGSCLSGGIDSSALVALSAGAHPEAPFSTFTASYHDSLVDESHYAHLVSSYFPNIKPCHAWPTGKGLWEDFRTLIWHQDLPIHSTSMYAQWEVMKTAGQHGIKVLLDGQGADEIMGGYDNFLGFYLLQLLRKGKISRFVKHATALKKNRVLNLRHALGRAAFQHLPSYHRKWIRGKTRLGEGFLIPAFRCQHQNMHLPDFLGKTTRDVLLNSIRRGLHDLLRYEDRNAMAFSIESRVPYLDHPLVEYCLALPTETLVANGFSKHILRHAVRDSLPEEIVWRKDKKGFVTPQSHWQKEQVSLLRDFLLSTEIPIPFNAKEIHRWAAKEIGPGTLSNEFWKLISILVWKETFGVTF